MTDLPSFVVTTSHSYSGIEDCEETIPNCPCKGGCVFAKICS